jgi:hypothetical protein
MGSEKNRPTAPLPTAPCPRLESCALFPKLCSTPVLNVWQTCYCRARFEECARFKLTSQGRPVPVALLPNGKEMAAELRLIADV